MPIPDSDTLFSEFPILDQSVNGHRLVYLDNGRFRDRAARPEGRTTPPTDPDERN